MPIMIQQILLSVFQQCVVMYLFTYIRIQMIVLLLTEYIQYIGHLVIRYNYRKSDFTEGTQERNIEPVHVVTSGGSDAIFKVFTDKICHAPSHIFLNIKHISHNAVELLSAMANVHVLLHIV